MKRLGIFLILALFLWGCEKQEKSVYRVVTGVQVEYTDGADTIYRSYTKHSSMQSILTYLRILRPYGPAVPQEAENSGCRITLHYSHGQDTVYVQKGKRYLCRDGGQWENIDHARANLLYPLLLLLPSDA